MEDMIRFYAAKGGASKLAACIGMSRKAGYRAATVRERCLLPAI
jgi:hypothetical protein